ncbi:MAG: hypothetical protein HN919_13965 [Verrucomicrobia bacterium]|mgnify:CR=1 FL=1|jgi:hypothetical protein|nr:hypothetical protein [Verrucomicrobiota bacterium]
MPESHLGTAETIARHFTRARDDRLEELLRTLVAHGQAREDGGEQHLNGVLTI